LRRTRERISVGATDGDREPCDAHEFALGDRVGYLNNSGDISTLAWTPEDHVLAVVWGSLVSESDFLEIAGSLVPGDEADWNAAIAQVPTEFRVTDAAYSGASWQNMWDGRDIVDESIRLVPAPDLEYLEVLGDEPEDTSEPVWTFTFCIDSTED